MRGRGPGQRPGSGLELGGGASVKGQRPETWLICQRLEIGPQRLSVAGFGSETYGLGPGEGMAQEQDLRLNPGTELGGGRAWKPDLEAKPGRACVLKAGPWGQRTRRTDTRKIESEG